MWVNICYNLTMIIREAKKSDYKDLMGLYNDFVDSDRYSKYDNDSFEKVRKSNKNFIYVAEDNDKLVGFVSFSIRLVIRYPKLIAELDELYVSPAFRRKSVGKMLMDKVLSKAKELNCHRLFIEPHYKHEGAHKFYENLGFTNYGYHFIKDL